MSVVLILLAAAILTLLLVASFQPSQFRITRALTINAPASTIFPHVNDLVKWHAWSPWAKMDPTAINTFEGPTSGLNASTSWVGKKSGAGKMTITTSRPNEYVEFQLDFLKPMKASNTAKFTFTPEGNHTNVMWSMYGKNNFIGKAINVIINCDKIVGTQFENGLADLKRIAEAK